MSAEETSTNTKQESNEIFSQMKDGLYYTQKERNTPQPQPESNQKNETCTQLFREIVNASAIIEQDPVKVWNLHLHVNLWINH